MRQTDARQKSGGGHVDRPPEYCFSPNSIERDLRALDLRTLLALRLAGGVAGVSLGLLIGLGFGRLRNGFFGFAAASSWRRFCSAFSVSRAAFASARLAARASRSARFATTAGSSGPGCDLNLFKRFLRASCAAFCRSEKPGSLNPLIGEPCHPRFRSYITACWYVGWA